MANERQLGTNWSMYVSDHDEFFPQNYMVGTCWSQQAGQPYFYQGIQIWMWDNPVSYMQANGYAGNHILYNSLLITSLNR